MADRENRRRDPVRETTRRDEQRRNPRYPNSTIWSDDRRREHRDERDSVLEKAGLVTDRMLGPDGEPKGPDADAADSDKTDAG